jgi:hypothetical protein
LSNSGFELTFSALAEQERAVSGLRARAGTVLAAASIAGSFFGAKTVGHSSLGAWGILAMVCFALCLGAAIWILLPHAFVFAFQGEELLAQTDHHGESNVTEAYRSAGIWMEPRLPANSRKIAERRLIFAQLPCRIQNLCVQACAVVFTRISIRSHFEIRVERRALHEPLGSDYLSQSRLLVLTHYPEELLPMPRP